MAEELPDDMCPLCREVCGLCDCDGYWTGLELRNRGEIDEEQRHELMAHLWALRTFDALQAQAEETAKEGAA